MRCGRESEGQSGLTLVEVATTVGILTLLAGLALQARAGLDRAERERASVDAAQLAGALGNLFADTRLAPTGVGGAPGVRLLLGSSGREPDLPVVVAAGERATFDDILGRNAYADERWRGPYLTEVPVDPWGQSYAAWIEDFHGPAAVWVLSAGPDGRLDTPPGSTEPLGDDLGANLP